MKQMNKTSWVLFISRRFARIDTRGKNALTAFLFSLGIAFGVMTLIVVMAVMNGFQMGYIESILEIHSFHIRAVPDSDVQKKRLEDMAEHPLVRSIIPFMDAQALTVGKNGRQEAAFIRFVPQNIMELDRGFAREIAVYRGNFDLGDNQAVVASQLAYSLGIAPGDKISLLAISGSSDVDLLSSSRVFTVSGLFSSSYSEINNSFVFLSLDTGQKLLGSSAQTLYGIKLHKPAHDNRLIHLIKQKDPYFAVESWRTYNKSFFGALKVEKNVLTMLVFIIFIVVGVNIFNGMRRIIFERREEISVLSALGAPPFYIQAVFLMQGMLIGLGGAVPGLLLGMLISVRMDAVFWLISKTVYGVQYIFTLLLNPSNLVFLTENPMFMFYARIPARMFFVETAAITIFGILSALSAAYAASRNILKLSIAEVLRYE
ncbi:ABC transporter permease [Treponema sp. OMZ 840]